MRVCLGSPEEGNRRSLGSLKIKDKSIRGPLGVAGEQKGPKGAYHSLFGIPRDA